MSNSTEQTSYTLVGPLIWSVGPHNGDDVQRFISRYKPQIVKYCRRRNVREDDIEDEVQKLMGKLLGNIDVYRPPDPEGKFGAWLYVVTRNACDDYHRRRRTLDRAHQGYVETKAGWVDNGADVWAPEDRDVEMAEQIDNMKRRVKQSRRLMERSKDALLMLLDGHSFQDVRAKTNFTPGALRQLCHRFKKSFGRGSKFK